MRLENVLFGQARRHPTRSAINCGGKELTFEELTKNVRLTAMGLKKLGVEPGDRVVVYLRNSVEFVQVLFGVLAAGAIAVPVATRMSINELTYFCKDAAAKVIFCHADSLEGVQGILAECPNLLAVLDKSDSGMISIDDLLLEKGVEARLESQENDTALILYTSGATGKPKGVEITHANVLIQHSYIHSQEWNITGEDRYLVASPMAHRAGLGRLMNAMLLGGSLVALDRFDPAEIVQTIEGKQITVFGMVPTMCRMLLPEVERDPIRCASLSCIPTVGEAFPVELKQRLLRALPNAQLVSLFGMTEAGCVTNLSHQEQFSHPATVGRATPGIEVMIADELGNELPAGEVGELAVKSGRPGAFTIMKGYFNKPDETGMAIRSGWFFTGDLAKIDGEGYITIVDRKKDMIVTGGFNVYSKEVENVIVAMTGVCDVAVVGVPDPVYGEAVVAFIETDSSAQPPTAEAIQTHCRNFLAGYKKPKFVFYRQTLPRNAVGKILKRELAVEARSEVEASTLSGLPSGAFFT